MLYYLMYTIAFHVIYLGCIVERYTNYLPKLGKIIILVFLITCATSCSMSYRQHFSGEKRRISEIALLHSAPFVFIVSIDGQMLKDGYPTRNNFNKGIGQPGKRLGLLPGTHKISVAFSGYFRHVNPAYTYVYYQPGDPPSDKAFFASEGSAVYIDLISSDTLTLEIKLKAGKGYEIRPRLIHNPNRPFDKSMVPRLVAPRNPAIQILANIADMESYLLVPRPWDFYISDFAWEAYVVELGSEEDKEDQLPENRPLARALDAGQTDFAQFLIAAGEDVHVTTRKGTTFLHKAAIKGDVATVELLISSGLSVNDQTEVGMTPLHLAANEGNDDIVEALILHGANVNARNDMKASPLFYAAGNGHLESCRILLDHKADVNAAQKNKWTPLHHAAHGGYVEVVDLLLSHKADIDKRSDIGLTPLIIAVNEGHIDVVQTLIEHGARLDIRDNDGWNALHYAALDGKTAIARLLLDAGADVDAVSKTGCTALHNAARGGYVDVARILLDHGADINAATDTGWRPLHMAAAEGHLEVGKLLIARGADVTLRHGNDMTARDVALATGHLAFAAMLGDDVGKDK